MTALRWGEDDPLVAALRASVDGTVSADEPLAPRTTMKVGGNARVLVSAESVEDLLAVSRLCAEFAVDWLVIGRGSNMLIADTGWDGIALVLGRGFRGFEVVAANPPVWHATVGAAEPMPVLANNLEAHGLGGLAFGVAIPGAVGGAVRMNAGAHGGQMADVLVWADVVRLNSQRTERWYAADLQMGYRHTDLPRDAVVTRARLALAEADADTLAQDMAEMRQWRRDNQPINEPSCGSVFRNPDGDSAGRLIETAHLKGHTVGGAQVSTKHANFITVSPGARAGDVHAVIQHVQHEVARLHGVHLMTEVVIEGFPRQDT